MKAIVTGGFLDNSHENMLIGELTPNCSIMPIGKSVLETSIEELNLIREQINSTCGLSPMLINTFLNTKFALNIPIVEHIDLIKKIDEFDR